MPTPKWQAGHLYLKGDLVQPVQAVGGAASAIANAGFESGDSDWTKGTGWVITNAGSAYAGSYSAEFQGAFAGPSVISMATPVACSPGQSITAKVKVNTAGNGVNDAGAAIRLIWYDASDTLISVNEGNICRGGGNAFFESGVTATAPANAAKVAVGCNAYRNDGMDALWIDNFTWNHLTPSAQEGLIYKAVQDDPGHSDNVEPAWPTTLGVQVVDNEVIWEAVLASRVTYEARPILKSGETEPTWPTTPGAFVVDGTISWECVSRRIEDENCPNTKVVHILAGKVFAVDGDIIRFCATANPLDWTTAEDAGYLPSGLQSANANDMAVLHQYRGNLAAFNASSFQNWQADPNPAAMAILDQIDGIGSTWPKAAQAVANDLLFLSQRGVRSVGIAAGAENLSAGDVGIPIDVLVQEALRVAESNSTKVLSTHYPGAGQYWLTFSDYPPPALSISGDLPDGYAGEAVSYEYTVSGGVLPYASVVLSGGALPDGLSLDTSDLADGIVRVTGARTTAGVYALTLLVTDADGETATLEDDSTTHPFTISGDLPDGVVGQPLSGGYTNTHGVEPITYAVGAGIPTGGTLGTDGNWTGAYTTAGAFAWLVTATDAAGNIATLNDSNVVTGPLAFIARENASQTYRYNADGNATTSVTTITGDKFGVAVSRDYNSIWVCDRDNDRLYRLNATTLAVEVDVATVNAPVGVVLSPDGSTVYVQGNTQVRSHSTTDGATILTGTLSASSQVGSPGIAIHPDGSKLYTSHGVSPAFVMLDAATLTETSVVASSAHSSVCINPAGTLVYAQRDASSAIDVYDASSGAFSHSIAGGSSGGSIAFLPDGSKFYVAGLGGTKIINATTEASTNFVGIGSSGNHGAAVSADGGTLFVVDGGSGTLYEANTATATVLSNTGAGTVYGRSIASRALP